jgi:protein gp37
MSTGIQWTDEVWNPSRGCSIVSAGCTNCYAMQMAHRFSGPGQPYDGLTRISGGRPVWTGDVRLVPEMLDKPLRWRKPRRIFVDSMSDLFHPDVPDEYIAQVFDVMRRCERHTFQILTKRPDRMAEWMSRCANAESMGWVTHNGTPVSAYGGTGIIVGTVPDGGLHPGTGWPLPNVWLGTSVENQEAADERIPHLLRCPAAVRFLSCEPLLERTTVFSIDGPVYVADGEQSPLHWVVIGGESGPRARPCDVQWIRDIRDQCKDAGVACFIKQLGAAPTMREDDDTYSVYLDLRDSHGGDPSEWPEDLRVREYPVP